MARGKRDEHLVNIRVKQLALAKVKKLKFKTYSFQKRYLSKYMEGTRNS